MHLALKAYQELLMTVNEMDHSKDENIHQSANVIKSKKPNVKTEHFNDQACNDSRFTQFTIWSDYIHQKN